MCYIIRRCSRAPDASILDMPRRVFPAEAFYSLSRFVVQSFPSNFTLLRAAPCGHFASLVRSIALQSARLPVELRSMAHDARPRTPAARLIASRRSASARRHWILRRCLGPCRLAEAPFGSSRLPDTKAAPRADTKLHESSAGDLNGTMGVQEQAVVRVKGNLMPIYFVVARQRQQQLSHLT